MVVNPKLACGLQECVGGLWTEGFLTDFTVIVENKEFQCHRFILSACSGFFKCLLESQMKESLESSATLKGMTKATFEVILKWLYTGLDCLTKDNMLDVWYAVDHLQIKYLIKECEEFIFENISEDTVKDVWHWAYLLHMKKVSNKSEQFLLENITADNYMEIYHHAQYLGSPKVVAATHKFMIHQFDVMKDTEAFLKLSADDVFALVESDDLNVNSEDSVVDFILRWVSYVPPIGNVSDSATESKDIAQLSTNDLMNDSSQSKNLNVEETDKAIALTSSGTSSLKSLQGNDLKQQSCQEQNVSQDVGERKIHLVKLLSAARLCLVSTDYLEKMQNNSLITSCTGALKIVSNALMYQLKIERREGQWPTSAIYKEASNMEHVMIFIDRKNQVKAYSLVKKFFHQCGTVPGELSCFTAMIVHDNVLYIEGRDRCVVHNGKLQLFRHDKQWIPDSLVTNMPHISCTSYFLPFEGSIIRLNSSHNCLWQYDVKPVNSFKWSIYAPTVNTDKVTGMVKFKNFILLFKQGDTADKTIVICVETTTKQVTLHTRIDGPSDIISFIDNKDFYILQANGVLSKILNIQSGSVDFQYISNLWDVHCKVHGAVSFRNQLFVFVEERYPRPQVTCKSSIPGVFPNIQIVETDSKTQCLPMIVPKWWLS